MVIKYTQDSFVKEKAVVLHSIELEHNWLAADPPEQGSYSHPEKIHVLMVHNALPGKQVAFCL